MKIIKNGPHDHSEEKGMRHWPKKIRQYLKNLYSSKKCNCVSRGSYNIIRAMSWPRGENWRRTHPHSLNKQHKK